MSQEELTTDEGRPELTSVESMLVEPTFVARVLRDNEVFANWIIGVLDGCEGCTEEATKWVEGQVALRDAHRVEEEGAE